MDKATQTDESCSFGIDSTIDTLNDSTSIKSEKVLRQRLQRVQQRTGEHSVSSQTLSPIHSPYFCWYCFCFLIFEIWVWKLIFDFLQFTASPVSIPPRSCATHRPMRSSVEGLNQEIEKLVLVPGQPHSCRPESGHVNWYYFSNYQMFAIQLKIISYFWGWFYLILVYSWNTWRTSGAISRYFA